MDEFEIINKYLKKLTAKNPGAFNLSDDIFYDQKSSLAVTIDTYNEGVHFLNLKKPYLLIKKIIRSSISDLICKGVNPKYIFISVSGNKNIFNKLTLKKLTDSIQQEQKKFGFLLSGGDTSFSKKISFTVTCLGFSKKIIKRNNAKINDNIYVTGNLGDSFIGLNILKKKIKTNNNFKKYFLKKYYLPVIQVNFSKYLIKYANTSMDISDGLFADLSKLIKNQNLGFEIDIKKVKISKNLSTLLKINKSLKLKNIISQGDDYQILFTANSKYHNEIETLSNRIKLPITKIGKIIYGRNNIKILNGQKLLKIPKFLGYLHSFK
tara:strand:+ start:466 stop:1431 length:966 start_codon:yes stop_codon:yes gene_type:complete